MPMPNEKTGENVYWIHTLFRGRRPLENSCVVESVRCTNCKTAPWRSEPRPLMGIVQATASRGRASSSRPHDRFLSFWNDLLGEDTNLVLFVSFGGGPEDECIQP